MSAEDDGVIAREAGDQLARLDNLFGIETGSRLIEDQNIGVVEDGLRQSDALAIAFRELADQLCLDVAQGTASSASSTRFGTSPSGMPFSRATKVRYSVTSISG